MDYTKDPEKDAASYRSVKTEIRTSHMEGCGLFAREQIRKGEMVSVRGGHILTRKMEKYIKQLDGYRGILCCRRLCSCSAQCKGSGDCNSC